MTPTPETIAKVRAMVVEAQARGLDWKQMRDNADIAAGDIGRQIAAVITNGNDSCDKDLAKLLARAETMRADYAAFLDIWWEACE